MVRPKPHRNLFLRWFRKAQRDSVRGKGGSFFSSVAPTIQLLFTEPVGQEWGRDWVARCVWSPTSVVATTDRSIYVLSLVKQLLGPVTF